MRGKGEQQPRESLSLAVVSPAMKPAEIKKAWREVQAAKRAILDKSDFYRPSGVDHDVIKKSGVLKLAFAFNIACEILDERRAVDAEQACWHVRVRATAPNGRFVDDVGSCSEIENNRAVTEANMRHTAQTRAYNRAVLKLVGLGDVTAEEFEAEAASVPATSAEKQQSQQKQPAASQERKISQAQVKLIHARWHALARKQLGANYGPNRDNVANALIVYLGAHFKVESVEALPAKSLDAVLSEIAAERIDCLTGERLELPAEMAK
jgi:hypothetical protein